MTQGVAPLAKSKPPASPNRMTISAEKLAAAITTAPGFDQLGQCSRLAPVSPQELVPILDQALRFAADQLDPLRPVADRIGCRLENGRVVTPPGHKEAWQAFIETGFPLLDLPEEHGGLAMPRVVSMAVQEIMDRSCPAFGMLALCNRSAARLIGAHADPETRAEWLPHLAAGDWGATICISEADAGSDAGRMRAIGEPDGNSWVLTGEKTWISFGDHDLTDRIGHCALARTATARGLSLFLVPDGFGEGSRNRVTVHRLEEKLGLHGSPTCVMGFDRAQAILIGEEGRGLQQMFTMITNMRLTVGAMGLGIAQGALDVGLRYASERKQGGPRDAPPVPIADHPDVQRMLLDMASEVMLLRGLAYAAAVQADIADHHSDERVRTEAGAATSWLLPIVKTLGGEIAFSSADTAIQVLGGAGYTREWPVEQALRDCRVLTIFEGTTGIQALDMLHRRLGREQGEPLRAFARLASATTQGEGRARLEEALDLLSRIGGALAGAEPVAAEASATDFLHLATAVARAWIAVRQLDHEDPRQRALAAHWLSSFDARLAMLASRALPNPDLAARFAAVWDPA
jgi:3-(methylthio)propanoyl-CoA dehydrogenase